MNELRDRVVREVRKVVVGQDHVVEVLLAAVTVGGHVLLEGVPGVAKTLLANAFAPRDRRRVPARAVHARHAAVGPHRHDDAARRRARVPARSGVHQPAARRRDQPHAAEDAGRAARSDAGAPGERRRRRPSAPRALRRRRDPEPDRVRGHLPACPKRSSTGSSPSSTSGTRARRTKRRCSVSRTAASRRRRSTTCRRSTSPAELLAARATSSTRRRWPTRSSTTSSRSCAGRASSRASALGASPRAAVHLLAASKAAARLAGRDFVIPDDVVAVAPAVLRHRLILRPEAELERYRADDAVATAISSVPVPR